MARLTTGFDLWKAHVLGEDDGIAKTPEWQEAETGVQRAALTEGRELDLRCAGLMKELLSATIDEWGTGKCSL